MAVVGYRSSRIMLYVTLTVVAAYTLIPLVTLVMTAIRASGNLALGPFTLPQRLAPIGNVRAAWIGGRFNEYTLNSVLITVPSVAIVLFLATLAGYAFGKMRFPFRDVLFYLVLVGMMVPFQAVMIPQYFLMNRLRLLNNHWAAILSISALGVPFGIFMMRSFFMGLPNELIESAKLDGATDIQTFRLVMLPLTYPAWASLLVFQTMWSWNNFLVPLLFIYDDSLRPIPLGLMQFQGRYTMDYTLVAAAVLIALLPLVVLYAILQRTFVGGITMGALKG